MSFLEGRPCGLWEITRKPPVWRVSLLRRGGGRALHHVGPLLGDPVSQGLEVLQNLQIQLVAKGGVPPPPLRIRNKKRPSW